MVVTDARLEFIADNPSCTISRGEVESIAKELQIYRSLAQMRKDMLDSELGHVFGGYSKEELEKWQTMDQ